MTNQSKKIERLLLGVGTNVVRRIQLVTMQVLTGETPVDTGFARSGWTPAIGIEILDASKRPVEDSDARSVASRRRAKNQARSEQISVVYKIQAGKVFISNAVNYIIFLDQGSSSQAPKNFVERGIIKAIKAALQSLRNDPSISSIT